VSDRDISALPAWPQVLAGRQETQAPAPDWYTVDSLAAWLDVSKWTVYRWNTSGRGPALTRVGKRVRYHRTAVEEWLDANTAAATQDT
jgi:excisionase family DNA binding protein